MIPDPIGDAVAHAGDGGLVAYPTETVWGLGVDARSERAVEGMRRFKGRSAEAPVSILVERPADLDGLAIELPPSGRRLAERFWPGPLTLVLPARGAFAPGVAREDGAVGVRCSSHPLAAALARRCRRQGVGPLTATSLNASGAPAARSAAEARAVCSDGPDAPRLLAVEGAEAGGAGESTVVDVTGARPAVLRWGAFREDELGPFLGGAR